MAGIYLDGVGKPRQQFEEVKMMIIGNYTPLFYEILAISAAIVIGGYLIGFLVRSKFSRTKPVTKSPQRVYTRELAGTAGTIKCDHCGNLLDVS
jgi:hypothetical protein